MTTQESTTPEQQNKKRTVKTLEERIADAEKRVKEAHTKAEQKEATLEKLKKQLKEKELKVTRKERNANLYLLGRTLEAFFQELDSAEERRELETILKETLKKNSSRKAQTEAQKKKVAEDIKKLTGAFKQIEKTIALNGTNQAHKPQQKPQQIQNKQQQTQQPQQKQQVQKQIEQIKQQPQQQQPQQTQKQTQNQAQQTQKQRGISLGLKQTTPTHTQQPQPAEKPATEMAEMVMCVEDEDAIWEEK